LILVICKVDYSPISHIISSASQMSLIIFIIYNQFTNDFVVISNPFEY